MPHPFHPERPHDLTSAALLSAAAAVCSALGALLVLVLVGPDLPLHRLACSQAALGAALLFLACCDLLPEAAAGISVLRTAVFFALGALGCATTAYCLRMRAMDLLLVDYAVGGVQGGDGGGEVERREAVLRGEVLAVGVVTFISLSAHNLLEGMSILFAVRDGLESGVRLAAAISLENVPEGVCIALPIYFATRSRSIAIRLALFSGFMECVGVLVPGLFWQSYIDQASISSVLAVISGILVFVALAEMLPLAVKTAGTRTIASLSVWMGCGVMSATLFQPLLLYHARVGLVQ